MPALDIEIRRISTHIFPRCKRDRDLYPWTASSGNQRSGSSRGLSRHEKPPNDVVCLILAVRVLAAIPILPLSVSRLGIILNPGLVYLNTNGLIIEARYIVSTQLPWCVSCREAVSHNAGPPVQVLDSRLTNHRLSEL
jgi:hypothetical protein